MRPQSIEIKMSTRATADSTTPERMFINTTIFDDWIDTPKSKLELILEQPSHKKWPLQPNTEDLPQYKYLSNLNLQDAVSEVLHIIIKRYMMLRRPLSKENQIKLDEAFKEHANSDHSNKAPSNDKLKGFFSKEKIAAFGHIKDAFSSIAFVPGMGVKALHAGLYVLYLGDQRFFKEQIKTSSEVAAEGGLARKHHYLTPKQKACELLNTLTPKEGWPQELDAFKMILPEFKSYLAKSNIKRPASSNIERTLRRWIKNDPLVSAAVRIHSQSSTTKDLS